MEPPQLHPGDRVVCLGDSITADPHGYVTLAQQVLARSRPGVEVVNAGVPGHTAADLAARFTRDVVEQSATWAAISVGGNDAIHAVPTADYAVAMQTMLDAAREGRTAVALCTPTPIEPAFTGAPVEAVNALLAEYAAWIEAAVEGQGLVLIPMQAVFRLVQEASDPDDPVRLTHDGVHMSPTGRYLMGLTFLAAFGISVEPDPN
jgi:lysophospholipase L1-like esterase